MIHIAKRKEMPLLQSMAIRGLSVVLALVICGVITTAILTGIYITGHGVKGVCQTLQKLGKDKTMHVIANDFLEENLKWLKEGTINFLIGQDAAVQGHSPVTILFQLLFDNKTPEKEYQYTDIVIRTKYNMG